MSILLSTAQTELSRQLRDITDVPNATFISWCDYINKFVYRELVKTDPGRYATTQSYSVSSSPSTQALPTGFRDIDAWETGFYKVDNGVQTNVRLARTGFGSQQTGYYIAGTNVVFTGINSSEVYTLRYIPTLDTVDELTDSFVIPDEYNEYILNALKVQYHIWDENPNGEGLSDARFTRSLGELLDSVRKEPGVYGLSNFSTSY